MSDPGLYRTRDEVNEWKRRDPLAIAAKRLADLGVSEDELKIIKKDVKEEIADAVRFAEESPKADEYKSYVTREGRV